MGRRLKAAQQVITTDFPSSGSAMIRLKRIYDPYADSDGKRVLVDRLWPRGIKKEDAGLDLWLKEIAPSNGLRRWFSHDPSRWQEFKRRYREELEEKQDLMSDLRTEARRKTVTLVFAAKDTERNNAAALKEILEE